MVLSFVLSNRKELVVERNTFSNPIGSMKCIGMEKHMSRTKRRKNGGEEEKEHRECYQKQFEAWAAQKMANRRNR